MIAEHPQSTPPEKQEPQKPRLRAFDPARAARASSLSASYTKFVRFARLALPLCALIIMGVVVMRLTGGGTQQPISMNDLPAEEKTVPGEIDMVEAKYQGADAQGRMYTVTAARARRDMTSPNSLSLEKPRADLALDGGKWLAMHAEKGLYDNEAGTLYLSGGVTLFHDMGYELHMQDVNVILKDRTASTDKPVEAQGPAALLQAAGMRVENGADLIVFNGPAHLTLHGIQTKGTRG